MTCRIDTQTNHWFQCSHGTVGCPRVHDSKTPHCIACVNGQSCPYHASPMVAMDVEEFIAANPEAAYLRAGS